MLPLLTSSTISRRNGAAIPCRAANFVPLYGIGGFKVHRARRPRARITAEKRLGETQDKGCREERQRDGSVDSKGYRLGMVCRRGEIISDLEFRSAGSEVGIGQRVYNCLDPHFPQGRVRYPHRIAGR